MEIGLPNKFALFQNFPNPFNPSTTIEFEIAEKNFTTLIIYDSNGQIVKNIVSNELAAGRYNYKFNGIGLSSGVYYIKLISGNFNAIKKMVLLK